MLLRLPNMQPTHCLLVQLGIGRTVPQVRWRDELPLQNSAGRSSRQVGTHDMVVASYVLGEVHDPQKRAALLRQLWGE